MSLIVFQHVESEDPAILGQVLQRHGHRLRTVKLHRGDKAPPDLDDVDGVISMGGPMNVDEAAQHPWINEESAYLKAAHVAGLPIVGICLGAQLIAHALGGKVAAMQKAEVGWHPLTLAFPGTTDVIYGGHPWKSVQFHLHGQQVTELPPGSTPLAGSKLCRNQAYRVGSTTYAFQYHLEWTRPDIARFAKDPFVERSGGSPQQMIDACAEHYDSYRRLGDRVCENLALFVFPIDKR